MGDSAERIAINVNFKNNDSANTSASEENGICIYDQRYQYNDTDAIVTSLSETELIEILKKVVVQNLKLDTSESSNPFEKVKLVAVTNADSIKKMDKNQILVFKCKKSINSTDYYTYYGYLKDDSNNTWVIYINNSKKYPVVFDIQDGLEPVFTLKDNAIDTISTGNFVIAKDSSSNFNYSGVELKNTAFNLGYNETAESSVTMIPVGVFIATN